MATSVSATTRRRSRRTTNASNGAAISGLTGDSMASALLGEVDSGAISTTNFRLVAEGRLRRLRAGRLEGQLETDREPRLALRVVVADRRAMRAAGELRPAEQHTLHPARPNQNLPLPPNFAALFPTVTVSRGQVSNTLIPWDKLDFGPRLGIAYQVMDKTVIRVGYGMFYGGEENQGGSPNRGEGVPFNETVNLTRYQGDSSFVGVTQPQCTSCNFFPGGFTGGYPLTRSPCRPPSPCAACSRISAIRWCTSGTSSSSANCPATWPSNSATRATTRRTR